MADQADHSARALPPSVFWRVRQIARRGLREVAARLWSSLWQVVIGVGIWSALVLFSRAWLAVFARGPTEALWRRLGYGRGR